MQNVGIWGKSIAWEENIFWDNSFVKIAVLEGLSKSIEEMKRVIVYF